VHQKYEAVVVSLPVEYHKAVLPKDIKYIIQIAYKQEVSQADLDYFRDIMNLTTED